MNEAQTKALRQILQRASARAADQAFPFFYCQQAASGEPVLLVQRRLSPGDLRAVRRTAKLKKFVRGIVYGDQGQLIFQAKDHTAGQFPRVLRLTLGAKVRALKKARVIGLDGEEAEVEEIEEVEEVEETPRTDVLVAAEETLDRALMALDEAQVQADTSERARKAAKDALQALVDADPTLAEIDAHAEVVEAIASEAAEQVLDLQEALSAAEQALEDTLSALGEVKEVDPADALALGERSLAVTALREQLRAEAELAAGADAQAREARATAQAAILASEGLSGAREALAAAGEALEQADVAESIAEDEAFEAESLAEDAARRVGLAPELDAASEVIAEHAAALTGLGDINPREPGRKGKKRIKEAGAEERLAQLQELLDDLLAAGATVEDARPLFEQLPSDWRPAALTEHMQWFQRLQQWESSMDSVRRAADQQEEIETLLRGGDVEASREAKLAIQEHYADNLSAGPPEGVDVNDAAELMSLMKASADQALRTARAESRDPVLEADVQGIEGYDQATDPVLKRMRDERMLELAASMGEEGIGWLSLLATEAPAVALFFSGTNLARELTQAGLRIVKQVRTASLVREAEESDSVAVEALRQAKAREGLLALHHSIQTVSATFDVGTDVMVLMGGITLPIAFAVKIGTSIAASHIESALVTDKERAIVARAEEYREAALAGDPEAARKLFSYSKRYAKGMLAWLAVSGDEIAQKYASMQGIPQEELEKTCPAVLQRYLLRAAKELDEADKVPSWLAKITKKLTRIFDRIGSYLLKKYESIDAFFGGSSKALPEVTDIPDRVLAALDAALRDFSDKRAFLALRPIHNALLIIDLDETRDVFDREADGLLQAVADNLLWLGEHQQTVQKQIEAGTEVRSAEKMRVRLDRAAQHNVTLMQRLSALP